MKVAEVLDYFPQALSLFLESGFQSLANPADRQTFRKVVSIEKACGKYGVNTPEFIEKLNREIFKINAPSKNENTNSGREIIRGEKCQADTWVGSLVKAYPTTKKVFESHYGEGYFSCSGQAFETVEQTASLHNVTPEFILAEINNEIEKELKPF